MQRKTKTFIVVVALFIALVVTPACRTEEEEVVIKNIPPGGTIEETDAQPTPTEQMFTGFATNTWNWGEGTNQCDTQDKFELIIGSNGDAVLRLHGVCFNSYCESSSESDPLCGLVLYGHHSASTNLITFNACNNPGGNNAQGSIRLGYNFNTGNDYLEGGTVSCWFNNAAERHTITIGEQ